jgi:hypothetical protein
MPIEVHGPLNLEAGGALNVTFLILTTHGEAETSGSKVWISGRRPRCVTAVILPKKPNQSCSQSVGLLRCRWMMSNETSTWSGRTGWGVVDLDSNRLLMLAAETFSEVAR